MQSEMSGSIDLRSVAAAEQPIDLSKKSRPLDTIVRGFLFACGLPLPRADRERRAHDPVPLRQPQPVPVVGRHDRRRGGRGFRQGGFDAGIALSGRSGDFTAAERGDPKAYSFPRPFAADKSRLDFSFSGLKTAVRYAITGQGRCDFSQLHLPEQQVADLAASFQAAVIDCLVEKTSLALQRTRLARLCVGGGVAANKALRARLQTLADERNVELHIAPLELCTDNAVMGAIAVERLKAGAVESLDLDILPGLVRHGPV